MPRKPLDQQHNGRYVKRWISGDNNHRKAEKQVMGHFSYNRYHSMLEITLDWEIVRNPRMKPLMHQGRKP